MKPQSFLHTCDIAPPTRVNKNRQNKNRMDKKKKRQNPGNWLLRGVNEQKTIQRISVYDLGNRNLRKASNRPGSWKRRAALVNVLLSFEI